MPRYLHGGMRKLFRSVTAASFPIAQMLRPKTESASSARTVQFKKIECERRKPINGLTKLIGKLITKLASEIRVIIIQAKRIEPRCSSARLSPGESGCRLKWIGRV